MVRVKQWFTAAGTNNAYGTSYDHDLAVPEGTILRMVGTVLFDTTSTPPSGDQYLAMGWMFNVGSAGGNPLAGGLDPEPTLIRKLLILPGNGPGVATAPIPVQDVATSGRRIIPAGESVWFAAETVQASVSWLWVFEVRILLLLPEA